jgi:hypothetical protein
MVTACHSKESVKGPLAGCEQVLHKSSDVFMSLLAMTSNMLVVGQSAVEGQNPDDQNKQDHLPHHLRPQIYLHRLFEQ